MFGTPSSWKCLIDCSLVFSDNHNSIMLFTWGLLSKADDLCWVQVIFLFQCVGKVPSVTCSQWNQLIPDGAGVKNHSAVATPLVFTHFDCQHDNCVVTLKAIVCPALWAKLIKIIRSLLTGLSTFGWGRPELSQCPSATAGPGPQVRFRRHRGLGGARVGSVCVAVC